MEPTTVSNGSTDNGADEVALAKAESAKEFDELFSMDALKLVAENALKDGVPSEIRANGKLVAGSTFPKVPSQCGKGQQPPPHTFSESNSSSFSLRVGPNYAKLGTKAPAGPSLYEAVGADRIDDFASKVHLPEVWCNIDTHHPNIPQLFVVNVQLPEDFSSSFFTTKTDGLGWSLVLYFRIRQETADALKNLSTAPNAVRLFAQYCMEAPEFFSPTPSAASSRTSSGTAFKSTPASPAGPNPWVGRFKIILRCEDIEQFGLPSFITAYNSKPVLIRNTGTLIRGAHYVEMDINVHKFASLPKRALEAMFTRFDKMVFSAAFCVESRTDDEMPEALFGSAQINFPTHTLTPQWQPPQPPAPHPHPLTHTASAPATVFK